MKDITLREFSNLKDAQEYTMLDYLNAENKFAGKSMNIHAMPYINVKHCFKLFGKIDSWEVVQSLFEICFDVSIEQFWNAQVSEFFTAKKYMLRAFEDAAKAEAKQFSGKSEEDHLWMMAGADRLKPLSDTLPLIQLGKQLGQYPFDLGRKPYGEIMNLLISMKVQGEVEYKYQKLKR